MTLSDLASLGSLIAIALSLIYVSVQMREARTARQSSIRAARAYRNMHVCLGATAPALAEAVAKGRDGTEDMSGAQLTQFRNYCLANFYNTEDSFYQYEEGSLSDAAFASLVAGMRSTLTSPGVRVIWRRARGAFGPEFVDFVTKLIAEIPVGPPVDQVAQWNADIAAEKGMTSTAPANRGSQSSNG